MANKFSKAFKVVLKGAKALHNKNFRGNWKDIVESAIKQGVRREDAVAAALSIYTYPEDFGINLD